MAGYIGWAIGGPVDAVAVALVGGVLTGAGLGAVQSWAAKGELGRAAAWIGAAQGLAPARQGDPRLAATWGAAMPVLFALGWCATSAIGASVEDRFTVFGRRARLRRGRLELAPGAVSAP